MIIFRFTSFHLLPSIILVRYFCIFTVAVTLATFVVQTPMLQTQIAKPPDQIVKRGRLMYDNIECPGPLPPYIPQGLPEYPDLLAMCSNREGHEMNLACACASAQFLECGRSRQAVIARLIDFCFQRCNCGKGTINRRYDYTKTIPPVPGLLFGGVVGSVAGGSRPAGSSGGSQPVGSSGGSQPVGSSNMNTNILACNCKKR